MYRFILTRHRGVYSDLSRQAPQSANYYEIPRQARNDENRKNLYTSDQYRILTSNLLILKDLTDFSRVK